MNKTWKTRAKTIALTLLNVLLCLALLLSFLLTALSFAVRRAVGEREDYRRLVEDPAMAEALLDYARVDLETECLFYGLPFDIIDQSLSAEDATAFSLTYIDAVYDAVFVSGTLTFPAVDAAQFHGSIATALAQEEIEDAVIDDLAAEFAAVTTAAWRLGITQKILTPIHGIVTNKWVVRYLNGGPALAGVTALLFAAGLALRWRRIRRQAYVLTGTLTAGSILLFVPLWLLHRYGVAEKLVLGDSPLRTFMIRWVRFITAQLADFATWVLIASAALTLLAVIWAVWPKREKGAASIDNDPAPASETDATDVTDAQPE